jgi:glycosyltransferase involved in cell wall biosynthesis
VSSRALFVTPVVPGETGNGLSMRAGQWLQALAEQYRVDVVVIPLFSAHSSAPEFTRSLASSAHVISWDTNINITLPTTIPVIDESSRDKLHSLALSADVVVVFRMYLAEIVDIACTAGTPVVLDVDDLDWVREDRLGHLQESAAYFGLAELILPKPAVITCAATKDVPTVKALSPQAQVFHVPNGVRPPMVTRQEPADARYDLLFVGTLGYEPNESGARWLIEEVAPLIPGVRIAIVGASPSPELQSLANDFVTIAADVSEVSSWYANSAVAVVPLHAGAGTRIKIPEAWAHHLPVITTTIGAEGIENLEGALIADTPEQFAAHCHTLITNSELARTLAFRGLQAYINEHSMEKALVQSRFAIAAAVVPLTDAEITQAMKE